MHVRAVATAYRFGFFDLGKYSDTTERIILISYSFWLKHESCTSTARMVSLYLRHKIFCVVPCASFDISDRTMFKIET